MSVYKRGNTWWIKINIGGSVLRRSAQTTSKREAQALERKLRLNINSGDRYTYLDALTMWLAIAPKSMMSHARNTHEIYHVPLDQLPAAANRMANRMVADGLSVLTANRRLAVVRRVLNLAFREWDLIDKPLHQKVSRFSEKGTAREVYLTPEQIHTLASHITKLDVKAFVLVIAFTGLRKSELLKMQPSQWQPPYLVLTSKTKSGKPRTVPLVEELHDHVALPWAFTEHDLRSQWSAARTAIEMPELRLHDLRHSFASMMMSNPNVPPALLRDLLGHSSLSVTSKYTHLSANTADAVQSAIGHMVSVPRGADVQDEDQ